MKDERLLAVREDFRPAYAGYLKELDNREKAGKKPISFDDFLWGLSEKAVTESKSRKNKGDI